MTIFDALKFIGGLALFLFGMNYMGQALEKVSGGKLESVLKKMTDNRIKGVALGAGATAVIQSSSAVTVMLVSFVNSGIMQLKQAIGIIMGANIGTTITGWLLSLTGLESSNLFVTMLKPSSFSPILAIIGVGFLMFSKNEKRKSIGSVLIGFTVLIYGMESMTGAVEPLREMPSFINMLTAFSNPILCVVVGAVLTAVIQSSSASVGILQALTVTGGLSFATAFPIVLGQNIGTCVTAMLSAVSTSKSAKRTAVIHLLFNIVGVFVAMLLFYTGNMLFNFKFYNSTVTSVDVALIHTTFNVFSTIVLFPFASLLEKLSYYFVSDDKDKNFFCKKQVFNLTMKNTNHIIK